MKPLRRRSGRRGGRRRDPTVRAILALVIAFALAALAAWTVAAWQERRPHEEFGPGRLVIQPHGAS